MSRAFFVRTPTASFLIGLILAFETSSACAGTNLSAWVFPSPGGHLLYRPDPLGNRILDQSGVGYKGGTVPLPNSNTVPVKVIVAPVAGDNVANIQNAINQVSALPLDTNGFRGAVLLSNGLYPCASTIYIRTSGVVLRGMSSATNGSGVVLEATATNQYTLIEITGSDSASSGATRTITNLYVPVGARSFYVDNTNGLFPGAEVYVRRVATSNWIHDLGMDLLGPPPDVPWTPSGYMIDMDRVITHMEGNHVFVDAPITCAIDALQYANGTIRPFTWAGLITNVGIEHIFAQSDYFGSTTNETHGWTFVQFDKVANGWARDLVSQYFGYSCVNLNSGKFITVQDCVSLDPISIITGGRRYAFPMNDVQYCVVKNCYNRQDRHQFVTQSLTIGPNVFVDGTSDSAHAEAGPHQRWATGILWDNITVHGGNNDIQNAGNYGTGHGWEGANCVIWNNAANGFIVQNPPGAHNWLIGSAGSIQNGTAWNIGYTNMPHAPGEYDSSGSGAMNVFPDSIYFAQLQDRLAAPNLQTRDYWAGDIDAFRNSASGGEKVFLDTTWSNAVKTISGGQPLDGFDIVTNNHWIPFTFNFSLAPNEHIVAATFSAAMRAMNSAAGDTLYLNSTTNVFTFSNLGWLPIGTGTNTTVRVLDLNSQLSVINTQLQFNVAAQGDLGIDWAMLELQVAPNANVTAASLTPVADATVRGGTSAGNNFGSATNLTVRQDSSANNQQRSYLRWDLSNVTGKIFQARVVLTPVNIPASGIEQGVAVANSNNWTETGITWNNQPNAGERFATWIASTNAPVSFDVTPQVLDALQNDRQLSLELFSITTNSVDYASRENSTPSTQPQLVLSLLGAAPVISAISNQTTPPNTTTAPIAFIVSEQNQSASNLIVTGTSSNPALVPDANIIFGGSGSNRTVTLTPAANQTGITTISLTVSDPDGLSINENFTLTVSSHPPSVIIWNGPGAGANNWSSSADWLPAEAPEFFDDIKFFDAGANGISVSNVNNFVDANFGGHLASLQFGNTNGNHTTLIGSGSALNLDGANGLIVGTETDNGSSQNVFATITGGGTLNLNNTSADLIVRQGSANNGSQRATLDLSGLGNFNATANQILVGFASPVIRATGTLHLARTNNIVMTGSPGICVGDNPGNGGGQNFFYLGQSNSIFVDSITIARRKANATMKFKPGLANPSVIFRASDGAGRIAAWSVGDGALINGSSSSPVGTNDFSGGTVDALVDTLTIGRSQQTSGANGIGALNFSSGIFDVNTLQIGFQTKSGTSAGIGFVNVSGANATLNVNTILELGFCGGATSTNTTFGALFINAGAASINSIATGAGSGTNVIALNNATFSLTNTAGSPALPVAIFAVTNSSLQFNVAAGATNFVATTLFTGGSSNAINIASLPVISSVPTQFPLIQYSGAIGGAGFNFVLGSLPSDAIYLGYLSNNLASHSVDLVITSYVVPDSFLTWNGISSGDWDTETGNWKNNVGSGLIYSDGDAVVFNDNASGATNINLTDTFAPSSVTVSNRAKLFTFADAGNFTGAMTLTKNGPGTLILDNSGSNDFTGGVVISGGTLQIGSDDANGNVPASGTITIDGALVFNRSDSVTLANSISGAGVLAQIGPGVLTLMAGSPPGAFTGAITISNGTLFAGSASAFSGNPISIHSGTLDVNGQNLVAEPVTVSGSGVDGDGAIINSGAQQTSALRNVALDGDATFGGTSRWDIRNTGGTASLTSGGLPSNITKVGTNQVSLVGVNPIDSALGDIDIQQGVFAIQTSTAQLGDASKTIYVRGGATLNLWSLSTSPLNKKIILENGATIWNESGSSIVIGPITLTNGTTTFNIAGTSLTLSNNILSGVGGLTKTGAGTLSLRGANTYTGATLVSTGILALASSGSIGGSTNISISSGATLDVSGRDDAKLTLAPGQTLGGNGTINGNLDVNPGATLSPGNSIGALTVTSNLNLQGTILIELNKTAGTNDVLRCVSLNYGGALVLTNLAGPLAAGDSYKIFDATSCSGVFTDLIPPMPGSGLAWNTSALTNGIISIVVAPKPVIAGVAISGGNIFLSGTNGIPNAPFYIVTSTNLSLPLANWARLATNQFGADGGFSFANAISQTNFQQFYLLQIP